MGRRGDRPLALSPRCHSAVHRCEKGREGGFEEGRLRPSRAVLPLVQEKTLGLELSLRGLSLFPFIHDSSRLIPLIMQPGLELSQEESPLWENSGMVLIFASHDTLEEVHFGTVEMKTGKSG